MDRGTDLLQGLLRNLRGWAAPIKRATCATSVEFVPGSSGEFSMRVTWEIPGGVKQYEKTFTKQLVFGRSFTGNPSAWRVEKKACHYARDVMREVLAQRGAL